MSRPSIPLASEPLIGSNTSAGTNTSYLPGKRSARWGRGGQEATVDEPRLPVCELRWGAEAELSIVDCSLFASLAYHHPERSEANQAVMREDLDNWFGEGEWGFNVSMKVVNIHATLFRSTLTDTAVLAIAGTHSGTDTVLDLDIWMEAATMQLLGYGARSCSSRRLHCASRLTALALTLILPVQLYLASLSSPISSSASSFASHPSSIAASAASTGSLWWSCRQKWRHYGRKGAMS